MDRRAALIAGRPVRPALRDQIDQVIFTSVRSPVARGYRIVCASPGVSEDEQREIVQRAPSHGNLTHTADDAKAMAGFPMRTGRYAVLFCRHAGPEPSGRGGWRVHTHAFLLPRVAYWQLAFDPFRVETFARKQIEACVADPAATVLNPLTLPANVTQRSGPALMPRETDIPLALRLLQAALSRDSFLVEGTSGRPAALMSIMLAGLPAGLRFEVSFSVGLKLSDQRAFRLVFFDGPAGESARFAEDHSMKPLDLTSESHPPPGTAASSSPYAGWLLMALARWQKRQVDELMTLSDQIISECSAEELNRIADMGNALAGMGEWDAPTCAQLMDRWREFQPTGPVQRQMVDELRQRLELRLGEADRSAAQRARDMQPPRPVVARRKA